jgi:hypothetical protein
MAIKKNVIDMPADGDVTEVTDGSDVLVTDAPDVTNLTDGNGVTEGTEGTADGDSTDKPNDDAEPASTVAESMRINLHVLIDVDPAKWDVSAITDDAAEARQKVIDALMAGGFSEADAIATANLAHKPVTGDGPAAVRDAVKAYMLASMRELSQIKSAGATVQYYERPVKN